MRPTEAEIDLSALAYNVRGIKKHVHPAGIMAVVKANAYGHGDVEISRTVLAHGVDYLGVACVHEGSDLRQAGITAPILIFSGAGLNNTDQYLEYDLDATIYDKEGLENIKHSAEKFGKKAVIHIKVDTGMGRMGVHCNEAADFIENAVKTQNITVKGLYTHFATSDHLDKSFALLQIERFKDVINELTKRGIEIPLKHAANSGAVLDLPEAWFDMVRPGIIMYGYYPSDYTSKSIAVKPVMTFKTRVLFIKELERGESVSYNRIFIAEKRTRIATLPVGYADGYNRLLSNTGHVLIRGKRFTVAGQVCMDLIMVDLGDDQEIQVGDEVVLVGKQGSREVSAKYIADQLHTIPYEITCRISERVQRIYK